MKFLHQNGLNSLLAQARDKNDLIVGGFKSEEFVQPNSFY